MGFSPCGSLLRDGLEEFLSAYTESMIPMNRRQFLQSTLATALAASVRAAERRPPRIVLRSSWQTVNIGDIGHTPGVLRLLEEHLPDAEVRLWPSSVGDGVEEMLRRRFPKVAILKGPQDQKAAFAECDFLLHGSGASLVAEDSVAKWRQETGKPYGVYGITLPGANAKTIELLSGARFVFFRDSVSLALAKEQRLHSAGDGVRSRRGLRRGRAQRRRGGGLPQSERPGGGQVPLLHSPSSLHALLAHSRQADDRRWTNRSTSATRR